MSLTVVRWEWNPNKAAQNIRKHRVPMELAALALETDRYHLSMLDTDASEIRFKTLAMVGNVLLMIVHTEPEIERHSGEWVGRVISARKAKPAERRAYQNG